MNKNALKRQQRRNQPRATRAIAPIVPATCEWSRKRLSLNQVTSYGYRPCAENPPALNEPGIPKDRDYQHGPLPSVPKSQRLWT
jgi:hypothetical protein